jgi:hypothetical protein
MKRNELDRISEAIEIECSIQCSKCRKIKSTMQTDEYYYGEELLESGWRATINNIYCPECAKKYLKPKK